MGNGLPASERSRTLGSYEPSSRVKELPTVEHDPEAVKLLECPKCGYILRSSWYYINPRSSRRAVLVPRNGHSACGVRIGGIKFSQVHYKTVDGFPSMKDTLRHLTFCPHKTQLRNCLICSPSSKCVHGK